MTANSEADQLKEIARSRAIAEAARSLVWALDTTTPTWPTTLDEAGMVPPLVRDAWRDLIAALESDADTQERGR